MLARLDFDHGACKSQDSSGGRSALARSMTNTNKRASALSAIQSMNPSRSSSDHAFSACRWNVGVSITVRTPVNMREFRTALKSDDA